MVGNDALGSRWTVRQVRNRSRGEVGDGRVGAGTFREGGAGRAA